MHRPRHGRGTRVKSSFSLRALVADSSYFSFLFTGAIDEDVSRSTPILRTSMLLQMLILSFQARLVTSQRDDVMQNCILVISNCCTLL